jgi:hypothetical protein
MEEEEEVLPESNIRGPTSASNLLSQEDMIRRFEDRDEEENQARA